LAGAAHEILRGTDWRPRAPGPWPAGRAGAFFAGAPSFFFARAFFVAAFLLAARAGVFFLGCALGGSLEAMKAPSVSPLAPRPFSGCG